MWKRYELRKQVAYNVEHLKITLLDMDHDAGNFAQFGGNYINLLNWLEDTKRSYPIKIHSTNSVGVENMRAVIHKNNWTEVR